MFTASWNGVLGPAREATRLHICTAWDAERGVLMASNPLSASAEAHAFLASDQPLASVSGDREESCLGSEARARDRAPSDANSCPVTPAWAWTRAGRCRFPLELAAGEARELCFVLGRGDSETRAYELAAHYVAPGGGRARVRGARTALGRDVRGDGSHA